MAQGDGTHTVPDPERGQWHVAVARALGRATRATAEEIDIFRRNMARARDSLLPETRPQRRPLPPLLEKLGQVVSRHADQGFVTLRDDPVFWALVRHIYASRPATRTKPTRRRAAKRAKRRIARASAAEQPRNDESAAPTPDVENIVDAIAEGAGAADVTGDDERVLDAVAEAAGDVDAEGDVESVLAAVAEAGGGSDAAGDAAVEATAGDAAPVDEPESAEPESRDATPDEEATKEQP